jgi:hypothetical protein
MTPEPNKKPDAESRNPWGSETTDDSPVEENECSIMQGIPSPHDRLAAKSLQNISNARSLIEHYLPKKIVEGLKLETLALEDTSYVDAHLRRKYFDRLFSAQIDEEFAKKHRLIARKAYLLVLVDHKSTSSVYAVIQMLGYMQRAWEKLIDNRSQLTPIIPWIIYNGIEPWSAPTSLRELIPVPDVWECYVPSFELTVLDLSQIKESQIVGEPVLQVTLVLLKSGRSPEVLTLLRPFMERLSKTINGDEAKNLLETISVYIMSVNRSINANKIQESIADFWPVQPEPGSVAEQLIQQGEALGEARGEARGRIRMLQQILGLPEITDESFAQLVPPETESLLNELQQQLRNRP